MAWRGAHGAHHTHPRAAGQRRRRKCGRRRAGREAGGWAGAVLPMPWRLSSPSRAPALMLHTCCRCAAGGAKPVGQRPLQSAAPCCTYQPPVPSPPSPASACTTHARTRTPACTRRHARLPCLAFAPCPTLTLHCLPSPGSTCLCARPWAACLASRSTHSARWVGGDGGGRKAGDGLQWGWVGGWVVVVDQGGSRALEPLAAPTRPRTQPTLHTSPHVHMHRACTARLLLRYTPPG